MERETPPSGLSFLAMMDRAFSAVRVVRSWAGCGSSSVQPSSNASRVWLSKRPLALDRAPRPLTVICWVKLLTRRAYGADRTKQELIDARRQARPVGRMISVVVPSAQSARDLAGLLPVLVPAAVDGLVREVIVAEARPDAAILAICEDAGADLAADLAAAAGRARGELILALPPTLRLRPGWEESLRRHLERDGGPALVCAAPPSLFERLTGPRLAGVLLPADQARESKPADLADLRRRLGRAVLLT